MTQTLGLLLPAGKQLSPWSWECRRTSFRGQPHEAAQEEFMSQPTSERSPKPKSSGNPDLLGTDLPVLGTPKFTCCR